MSDSLGYPSVLCVVCARMKTSHRCLQPVAKGLLVLEMIGTVCGRPICGPCNFKQGNETIFRCPLHSVSDDDSSLGSLDSEKSEKESAVAVSKMKGKANANNNMTETSNADKPPVKVKGNKGSKGSEYSAKDLLILSQAYIKTSENSIEGTSQKKNKFWDDVADVFNKLKVQQEAYDSRQQKKDKMNAARIRGDFLNNDLSEDDVQVIIPKRTPSSLQQKWSKFVLPLVTQFIALTNRHPKKSGEGKCFLICL
jgi:hypothetical protein